jgi:glutamate/aspartate transport system substrate-binding protein
MTIVGWFALAGSTTLLSGPARADDRLERIKANSQINVGYREDAPPFSYLDAQGRPQGYSLDVCNAVVAQIQARPGMDTLRVNMVPVPVDRVLTYMKNGTVDLLCSSTSDTAERHAVMEFSRPIFIDGVSVMVRKKDGITTLSKLGEGPVAAIKTTTAPAVLADKAPTLKVDAVLNGDAGLGQLQMGWVKGYARDSVLLAVQHAQLAHPGDYPILPGLLSTENIAIAVPLQSADLLALVDKTIADNAASGRIGEWYERWFVKPITLGKQQTRLGLPMSPELKAALGATK